MSVLEKRYDLNHKIKQVIFSLQYKNNPIKLIGSAAIKSQRYYGDFDMISAINKEDSPEVIYEQFKSIIEKIKKDPDFYFIELKIQTKDEKKFRYYKDDELDLKTIKDNHKNISFIKIDMSMWFDYQFSDVSILYALFGDPLEPVQLEKAIRDELKEFTKEGRFYKILKRKFTLYKGLAGDFDEKKLSELTEIFNSELGLKYKVASNLNALVNLLKYYDDPMTKARVLINLKLLRLEHYKIEDLEKHADALLKQVNAEAKPLLKNFPI